MKVRGDNPPSNAFSIENQPKAPGRVLARFYENVNPFKEKTDGLTVEGFEYDEYHLELPVSGDMQDYVLNNFDRLFAEAKALDAVKQGATPEAEPDPAVAQLQADVLYLSMMTGVEL